MVSILWWPHCCPLMDLKQTRPFVQGVFSVVFFVSVGGGGPRFVSCLAVVD
jgi:hypothetical protein